jgi:hypothetical protein
MRKLLVVILILLPLSWALAGKKSDKEIRALLAPTAWPTPTEDLLKQSYYPMDSSANAVVVSKEMKLYYGKFDLMVMTHKRIKIYTEAGLPYAQLKELYTEDSSIDTIRVTTYNPDGTITQLAPADIHEETIVKSQKAKHYLKSKAFAAPNAVSGSVIDVTIYEYYKDAGAPPVFRFHEYLPVQSACFETNFPPQILEIYGWEFKFDLDSLKLPFEYVITNREMIHPEVKYENGIFTCTAENIHAIEDELYKLPDRNLESDLWMKIKYWWNTSSAVRPGDKWGELLHFYKDDFKLVLDDPGKAKKLADSLKSVTPDTLEQIKKAFSIVRDRWGNFNIFMVNGPSDYMNDMMKERELDGEDKATILCAMLRALGKKDAEVLWICSDKSEYSPMTEYPSRIMFDHAITYIPSDSLYMDPSEPGCEVGILPEILCERLACHPMSDSIFLSFTPKTDRFSNKMVNIKLQQDESGKFTGDASIVFYNQAAISMRADVREKGEKDINKILEKELFRNMPDAVKSYAVAADSLQTAEHFEVDCKIELANFEGEDIFELPAYPGPTYESTILDNHPPRKYPVYFATKDYNIYIIEWSFLDGYRPHNYQSLNSNTDGTLLKASIAAEYDSLSNKLSLRRSYKMNQRMFRPEFTPTLERFIQNVQKCDIATITLEKQQ